MAFPTTGILDNTTRADELPLSHGGDWSIWVTATGALQLLTNAIQADASAAIKGAYWNLAQFTDAEAYFTIAQVTADQFRDLQLGVRLVDPTLATYDGYIFRTVGGTGAWSLQRVVDGTGTTLTSGSRVWAANEKIGLEAVGNQISAYVFSGGSWSQLTTFTDNDVAALPGPGYIGVRMLGNTTPLWRITNFGGGAIASVSTRYGRRARARVRNFFR